MTGGNVALLALGLTLGNVFYQLLRPDSEPELGVAFERSFFQSAALLFAWLQWGTR